MTAVVQLRLDIQIELDRVDRALMLGLCTETTAQELKDAVQAQQRAAAEIVAIGIKAQPLSGDGRAYFERLLTVLRQSPYAE